VSVTLICHAAGSGVPRGHTRAWIVEPTARSRTAYQVSSAQARPSVSSCVYPLPDQVLRATLRCVAVAMSQTAYPPSSAAVPAMRTAAVPMYHDEVPEPSERTRTSV
jgi:hypothetical protein